MEVKKQRYYSSPEVAGLLSMTPQVVNRWLRDGLLTGYKLGTPGSKSSWRIREDDLNDFLARHRNGGK
jgi:excisionase family DNA binding protein